ncbi:hypothetical protein RB195_019006 [Necator americanus]|uniref:DUF1758 domain-containing protein n=1 Tax=Necator americanus TaxID=51031 RepID=A0ABR1CDZ1_NECAM
MYALIRQFCTYEEDSKEYGLGAILLNKLPRHVRSRIYDKTNNQTNLTPTALIRLLTDIVRKESTLREMESQEPDSASRYTYHVIHNQTQMIRSKKVPPSVRQKRCNFCSKMNHNSFNYQTYKTASERIQVAKNNRLCFNCLSGNHLTKDCISKKTCSHCSKRHHMSLCLRYSQRSLASTPMATQTVHVANRSEHPNQIEKNRFHHRPSQRQHHEQQSHIHFSEQPSLPSNLAEPATTLHTTQLPHETVKPPLMCADVVLFNPNNENKEIHVTALLDTEASQSYITNDLIEQLQLQPSNPQRITMFTLGTEKPMSMEATNHEIGIRCTDNTTHLLHVQAPPILTREIKYASILKKEENNQYLANKIATPKLLIGMDYLWDLVFHDQFSISYLTNRYRIFETRIGKIVADNAFRLNTLNDVVYTFSTSMANPARHSDLVELVERFWSNESLGIVDNPNQSDDDKCLEDFNNSIKYNKQERRYSVKFPFKGNPSELPTNRDLAFSRFLSNLKALQKNPEYMTKYHEIFTDQLKRGIIEEIDEGKSANISHYLAHHGVISGSKKHTKVRCVFDGSAKKKGGMSINEILHKGPTLLPDLLGVLRTRTMPIMVSSDIEKAFLMLELQEQSRNYTRFFWLRDPTKPADRSNIVVYRFRRVLFGLICSPFLLAATIHHHLASTGTPLTRKILRNIYVDNVFYGISSVDEGKQYYKDLKQLFQDARMNIRDYVSNNQELNRFMEEQENSKVDEQCKILGVTWKTTTDEFEIHLPRCITETTWTKRRVLQKVASTYDPFGWISPVVLVGKIFIQKLWTQNISWDESLPQHLLEKWTQIIESWTLSSVTFPRLLIQDNAPDAKYDIHVFSDASQSAYSASSYLLEKINGHPERAMLLVSKSRLAPKKPLMTIPKLELSGLLIGSAI